MVSLEGLTVDTFAAVVGDEFTLDPGEGETFSLELLSATPAGPGPEGSRAPFSIVFRGPADPILPQRIYRLAHPQLGELDIFIVPIGRDDGGTRYEAVFA